MRQRISRSTAVARRAGLQQPRLQREEARGSSGCTAPAARARSHSTKASDTLSMASRRRTSAAWARTWAMRSSVTSSATPTSREKPPSPASPTAWPRASIQADRAVAVGHAERDVERAVRRRRGERLAHPVAVFRRDPLQHLRGRRDAAAAPAQHHAGDVRHEAARRRPGPIPRCRSARPRRRAGSAPRNSASARCGAIGAQPLHHHQHGQDRRGDHRREEHAGGDAGGLAQADRGEAGVDRQQDQRQQDGERRRPAPAGRGRAASPGACARPGSDPRAPGHRQSACSDSRACKSRRESVCVANPTGE